MTRHNLRATAFKWAIAAIGALLAMRMFFVRQMLAALLIFSVLFVCLAVVALILFGLDLAWRTALGGAESFVMALARLRHGPASVNHSAVVNMLTPVPVRSGTSHK
jgi:uncharacterized MnhB-related membrane protein